MSVLHQMRTAIKDGIFGETILPEEFATGIPDPQQEISVMLEGMAAPIDVTFRHSTACSDPFLLAIAFDEGQLPSEQDLRRLSLKFYARRRERPLLGDIRLDWRETLTVSGGSLMLFAPSSARNRCLPRLSCYAHHSLHLLRQWKSGPASGMTMSFLERRGAMVLFIRPHPTVLVSAIDELGGNIFPMNIMGHSAPHVSGLPYATTDSQAGWSNAGRLVISNVPVRHASLAYALARNHTKASAEWDNLPFVTKPSPMFHFPIPEFALRVRELELEKVHKIGSHSFFVARMLSDTVFSTRPSLCVVHGYYETWRVGGRAAEMKAALREDLLNKRGINVQ